MQRMKQNVAMRKAEKTNLHAAVARAESDVDFRIVCCAELAVRPHARAHGVSPTASTSEAVQ